MRAQSRSGPRALRGHAAGRLGLERWDAVLAGLVAGTLMLWYALYRMYAVWDHIARPGFSFDAIPGHLASPTLRFTVAIFALLVVLYAAACAVTSRCAAMPRTARLTTILALAGSGVLNIMIYPVVAIDVFVYLIELKLAYFYRQNPYVVTVAPAFLGDPWARYAIFLQSPLIYGPAWLLGASWPVVLAGFDNLLRALLAYKLFSFAVVALCGLIIAAYYEDRRRGWAAAVAFVLNPLVLFEAVANAHNDIMMAALLLAAVLALKKGSRFAGALLVLSALVKFFTVLLAPMLLVEAVRQKWGTWKLVSAALLSVAAGVAAIVPFWADGQFVAGMRRAAAVSQGLATASIASLVRALLQQHGRTDLLLASRLALGGLFALAALLILLRFRSIERGMACTLVLFFTLVSSFQPWYLIPVIALLCLRLDGLGYAWICAASFVGLEIFMLDIWARFHSGLSFIERHVMGTAFLSVTMLGFVVASAWRESRAPRGDDQDARLAAAA